MQYNELYSLAGPIFMLAISIMVFMYPIETFTAIGRFYRKFSKRILPISPPDADFGMRLSFSKWIRLLAILVGGASVVSIIFNVIALINKH